jgi:hypothetical protein
VRIYRHTQIGTAILFVLGFGIAGSATVWILVPTARVVVGVVLVILLVSVFLFRLLTVEVTAEELVVSFGSGVIRKRFPVEDIRTARSVRNPWYYGWGIRLTPQGWLFNVSGFDAVELELNSNRKFRIGTDEPHRLIAAIHTARQLTRR